MTREESTGLGEESTGPARRTRARGSEKIARGRLEKKHGGSEKRAQIHEQRNRKREGSEGQSKTVRARAMVTRAGPARNLSIYHGARWAVARER